jgi:hypothetical protein
MQDRTFGSYKALALQLPRDGIAPPQSPVYHLVLCSIRHEVHYNNWCCSCPAREYCVCAELPPSRSLPNAWYDHNFLYPDLAANDITGCVFPPDQ